VGEQVEARAAAHVEDTGAAAVDDADEAGRLQALERLADRVPVDGEGGRELALGREVLAGAEATRQDRIAQLGEDLVGDRPSGHGGESMLVHVRHPARRVAHSSRGWTNFARRSAR
jgi:hypothetical protein